MKPRRYANPAVQNVLDDQIHTHEKKKTSKKNGKIHLKTYRAHRVSSFGFHRTDTLYCCIIYHPRIEFDYMLGAHGARLFLPHEKKEKKKKFFSHIASRCTDILR